MRPAGGAEGHEPWDLDACVFDGYMQGLREAGWPGDARLVRLGYAATAALRYTFMSAAEMLGEAGDEARYAAVERRRGQPIERAIERQGALVCYLLDLADEASALSHVVPRAA
jgi:hypothetical protein